MRKVRRAPAVSDTDKASAHPSLIVVAVTLFTIFAICEVDLHRDALEAVGLVVSGAGIDPQFVGP